MSRDAAAELVWGPHFGNHGAKYFPHTFPVPTEKLPAAKVHEHKRCSVPWPHTEASIWRGKNGWPDSRSFQALPATKLKTEKGCSESKMDTAAVTLSTCWALQRDFWSPDKRHQGDWGARARSALGAGTTGLTGNRGSCPTPGASRMLGSQFSSTVDSTFFHWLLQTHIDLKRFGWTNFFHNFSTILFKPISK